jgi:pimeloyl-ACP methyl ester carboxylesterase
LGDHYSIRTEDEDLEALASATGARYAFGAADGGLFALHASIRLRQLEKLALYEPVLFVGQEGQTEFVGVIERYNQRIAAGDLVGAMMGLTKDANVSRLVGAIPDGVLRPLFRFLLWLDGKMVKGDDVSLRQLLPTLGPELAEIRATEGTLHDYKKVTARVLLMQGGLAQPLISGTLDALLRVLPHSERLVLPGLRHGSAQSQGNPQAIAAAVRTFLRG